MPNNQSKILCFIGDGEGKTSAAIGHAVRAAGHGKKVSVIQFLKGKIICGEYKFLTKTPDIDIILSGEPSFVFGNTPKDPHIKKAKEGLAKAKEMISSGKYSLIVLDEVLDAHSAGLIEIKEISDIIDIAKENLVHLILTGRVLPPEISTKVDLITQMKKIKHYYDKGEKGIEGLDW